MVVSSVATTTHISKSYFCVTLTQANSNHTYHLIIQEFAGDRQDHQDVGIGLQ